uniref:Uncharacterized protein n=1 Tax=Oryza meridionalis TaxID=40149 RepID=A0A0E0D6I6_9ORYZ
MDGALWRHYPASSPRRRPWAELSADIVRRHVLCEVDRRPRGGTRLPLLARGARRARSPPPLTWLVVPDSEAGGPAFHCVPSGCRTHPFFAPHAARLARCFGSYDGAWLFLAVDDQAQGKDDHFLDLPNMFPEMEFNSELVIVAATLSSEPTEQGCIVAGIINFCPCSQGRWDIAFWRMGDQAILRDPSRQTRRAFKWRTSYILQWRFPIPRSRGTHSCVFRWPNGPPGPAWYGAVLGPRLVGPA